MQQFLIAMVLLGWLIPPAIAGRSNDDFASRLQIDGINGSVTGTNAQATKESGEPPHADDPGGASVWWTWTAPVSGQVSFATFGSTFDTLLAVYTGKNIRNLKRVAADNDFPLPGLSDVQSKVMFTVRAGRTYHIAVDGVAGRIGAIVLAWSVHMAADNFADRISVEGVAGLVLGSNVQATKESGEPPHAGQPARKSVWWTWTAPATAMTTFATLPSGNIGNTFNTVLAIYTGQSVNTLTPVAANNDIDPWICRFAAPEACLSRVTFLTQAGTTYHIAVDGVSGARGVVVLGWVMKTFNDNFADALPLQGESGTVTGANVRGQDGGATTELGEPDHAGNAGGASVWWRWTAPTSGPVAFDTHGSDFDTLLAVYTGSHVDSLTTVVSNDQDGSSDQSRITFTAQAGTTYSIAVDGYFGVLGAIVLHWQ